MLEQDPDIQVYYADSREQDYAGVGIFPYLTWHIIRKERFSLSYDNGVGPNFFFESFPEGGTKFNFTTFYGLKAGIKVNGKWLYTIMYRFRFLFNYLNRENN